MNSDFDPPLSNTRRPNRPAIERQQTEEVRAAMVDSDLESDIAAYRKALESIIKRADGEYEDARDALGDKEWFGGALVAKRIRDFARTMTRKAEPRDKT